MSTLSDHARAFLGGKALPFADASQLWKDLKDADELCLARRVLERLRDGKGLLDKLPVDLKTRKKLCQQEALLTSKDPELSTTVRHDRALRILEEDFGDLQDPALDGDAETLGIAGGILKRRWTHLGKLEDLQAASRFYQRGAGPNLGDDAYAHLNAAFLDDLLARTGDDPAVRTERAARLRTRIVSELPATGSWWNAASRAEAFFGLGRYGDATTAIEQVKEGQKPKPWELETTTRQLAALAHLREARPFEVPEIRGFFQKLLPGAATAARSAAVGKVGLALSGGGFRASFYHLGVLARLAELDVLRHVEVLSCVSGGSIVGACYWLALRNQLKTTGALTREGYIALVQEVIRHFLKAVATDLRGAVQPSIAKVVWRIFNDEKGALDPEHTARVLDEQFYRPLMAMPAAPVLMHELPFTPADHDQALSGSAEFHPGRHNWLRADKVPALVLNATTVNTGHAWQFTPTWMGESPWAVHDAADSIPRLEWSWYEPRKGWAITMGQAVAASACVPGVFAPLRIPGAYKDIDVHLVDGGVHDNQGTVSLLAHDCNVLLVSDACGQLLLENSPAPGARGLLSYVGRSMTMLMERVRLANFVDLVVRRRTGLLRGLMFLHMKAGLDADTVRLNFSQESYELHREPLSPSGVRKDFQQALAELRTDLDAFTEDESDALMACGYQMASSAFQEHLAPLTELWEPPVEADWPFRAMLKEITSIEASTPRRDELLAALRAGSKVRP